MRISQDLLEELRWIQKVLKTMGTNFDRTLVDEHLNKSIEFCKGVLFERERIKDENRSKKSR